MFDHAPRIPDPEASKPDDWDEDAPQNIPDPDAVKPDGWLDDGPELIPDPEATPPEDWDEEEDGEWEPPMIGESTSSVWWMSICLSCDSICFCFFLALACIITPCVHAQQG